MSSLTYGQLRDALEAALTASIADPDDDGYRYVWVCDFSDSTVVYCQNGEYFQDDYTSDDAGDITLAGSPVAVRPLTTYVETDQQANARAEMERRGFVAASVQQPLATLRQVEVKSEPLTYHRHAAHSYFRDLLLTDRTTGASERLRRHGDEMRVLGAEREKRAWQALHSGGVEYRTEPNRTDGHGGYFSPPMWLNELFATANRPARTLAGLIPTLGLPMGVSQVNLPIISTGTSVAPTSDSAPLPDQDFTDTSSSSAVVLLSGQADVSLQLLEQSPAGAHTDWAVFGDLTESYDADLELQLLEGSGSAAQQLLGVANVTGINGVTYTSNTPTGSGLWPFLAQAAALIGDNRKRPPECWLMRTARWTWLEGSEDTATRPFGIPSPFFLGSTDDTPDPVSGLYGWPVFCDDAIPVTAGQDTVILLRPRDLILLEGAPQTAVMREPLSGSMGARLQLRNYVAAFTGRRPTGISVVSGTGLTVQAGY